MSTITKKVSVYQENKKLKDILATKMKSLKITEKTNNLLEERISIIKESRDMQTKYLEQSKERIQSLHDEYTALHTKLIETLQENTELLEYKLEMKKRGEGIIHVKKYSQDDKRYVNIMSHMDILWHKGETGPDGCGKCNIYRDIIMSALDKVERMSSRSIDLDFSTTHIHSDEPSIDDNNNHITKIGGGDKHIDELEDL